MTEHNCLARLEDQHAPFWLEDLKIWKYYPDQKHFFSKISFKESPIPVEVSSHLCREAAPSLMQGNLSAKAAEGSAEQFPLYPSSAWR